MAGERSQQRDQSVFVWRTRSERRIVCSGVKVEGSTHIGALEALQRGVLPVVVCHLEEEDCPVDEVAPTRERTDPWRERAARSRPPGGGNHERGSASG